MLTWTLLAVYAVLVAAIYQKERKNKYTMYAMWKAPLVNRIITAWKFAIAPLAIAAAVIGVILYVLAMTVMYDLGATSDKLSEAFSVLAE